MSAFLWRVTLAVAVGGLAPLSSMWCILAAAAALVATIAAAPQSPYDVCRHRILALFVRPSSHVL